MGNSWTNIYVFHNIATVKSEEIENLDVVLIKMILHDIVYNFDLLFTLDHLYIIHVQ